MALNEKQEKFAQSYILHRNATEAAKNAGYAPDSAANQGYRLMQNQEVVDRVHELEQQLETDVDVINNGHSNSALKALELLSRIRGAGSDINTGLDKDTLETAIVGCLNTLGEEKVINLLEKCDFANNIFEGQDEEHAEEMESV